MFIELAEKTIVSLHLVKVVNIHNDSCITVKYFNSEPDITITYNNKNSAQSDYSKINDMLTKSCSNKQEQ
jgi:K+-transporting ATPase c subunit